MLGRTPSPGRAPDAPLNLNGSMRTADAFAPSVDVPLAEVKQAAERPPPTPDTAPEPAQLDGADRADAGARASIVVGAHSLLGWHGLRSTVLGVVLATLALALGIGSALSVSLLAVGVVFLVVGILGPRLQGRFAVEFGPNGASIDLRTQMAPPGSAWLPRPHLLAQRTGGLPAPGGTDAGPALGPAAAALLRDEINDARSETIELDTKRLQA